MTNTRKVIEDVEDNHAEIDEMLMTLAAVRYSIRQDGHIPGACVRWLTRKWSGFDEYTRWNITRDLCLYALKTDSETGLDSGNVDSRWIWFAHFAFESLSRDGQETLKKAVHNTKTQWPLKE